MQKDFFPPQKGKFTYLQTNRSDSLGSIWSSMGLDFQSDLNTMRVAPRLKVNTATATQANLGLPIAFQYFDTCLWAMAGTTIFINTSVPNTAFVPDTSTGNVTTYSANGDLEIFDSRLWSTTATALYSKAGNGAGAGSWTSRATSLSTGPHILKYFQFFNKLYYQTTSGFIDSIDMNNTVSSTVGTDYTISLGTANPVACIASASNFLWLGLSASTGGDGLTASVETWDGLSAAVTASYPLKSRWIVSMCVYEGIVYVMDGNGVLSKFSGYAFKEIGRLPFTTILPLSNYIHRNGMIATKNGTIQVLVDNQNEDSAGTIYENIPSGIWEWSEQFGFTHKYSFTYNPSASSTITDYGQNKISAPGALFNVADVVPFPLVSGRNGSLLAGATYYTDASTTTNAIFFDDQLNTVQKKGYFVTTWFFSAEIKNNWNRLWTTFRTLLDPNDSIVFKYRLTEPQPTYATITWVDTTHFTTTTNVTAYAPTAPGFNGTVGGEVEVLAGTGGASCVHITNISLSAGTYTVTIDDAVTGVTTGTAQARFQNWIKLLPEISGQLNSFAQLAIGGNDTRIQIKGCMTFTGDDEFYKLAIFSSADVSINA